MLSIFLIIMAVLALGIMFIMFATVGFWFIPVIVCLVLGKSLIKMFVKLVKAVKEKKDDVVVMSRKDFEANYVHKQ